MIYDCDEWVWDDEPFVYPAKGDGPKAKRLTRAMRQIRSYQETPRHIPRRETLARARYRDWQKGTGR